eukprot:EG_transcript_1500
MAHLEVRLEDNAYRPWWHFHTFVDPSLEAAFQEKNQRATVQSCYLWAAIQIPNLLVLAFGCMFWTPVITNSVFWALASVPLLCAVLLGALCCSKVVPGPHLHLVLCLCYFLTLLCRGVQVFIFVEFNREGNWQLPNTDPGTAAFMDNISSTLVMVFFHIEQQLQLVPLLHIGCCPANALAIMAGPLSNILLISLLVRAPPFSYMFFLLSCVAAGVVALFCRGGTAMRRSIFLLERHKAQHAEQMQRADAIANHILKNAMVEASGLIDAFLDLCAPPPEDAVAQYLHSARERLRGGMAWCRRRRVLLELLDGRATPTPKPTSLAALGGALASSRTMTTDFAPAVVELDEALVDLMLEIAISNAFRHGHPTDPDVRFTISIDVVDPSLGTCAVTFCVTNRCDPGRQPLTGELVDHLMSGRPPVSPSAPFAEGVGLEHCLQAAQVHGAAVSLSQQQDVVVFTATLPSRLVGEAAAAATPCASRGGPGLPLDLRIAVMDDSASARALLKHQLSRDIPGCIVKTFGASAEDVDPFLAHALQEADIAILDQHLDWPSGSPILGTDLVRLLLQAGFEGLTCIRSANMSELDIARYFAAGVHCALDKLLDRAQTVATLASHYHQLLASRQDRSPAPRPLDPVRMADAIPLQGLEPDVLNVVSLSESSLRPPPLTPSTVLSF